MNTILYARVSTDRQAQKDLSIPAQMSAMQDFAKKKGWKVIGTYIDAGESAKTTDRPELKNLLKFCKEKGGQVDIVMVHKIDRLARNLVDHATIKTLLKQRGIRLVCCNSRYLFSIFESFLISTPTNVSCQSFICSSDKLLR